MLRNKTYEILDRYNEFSYEEKIYFLEKLISDVEMKPLDAKQKEDSKELYLLGLLKQLINNAEDEKMYNYISSHLDLLTEDKKNAIFRRVYVSIRDGYDRQVQEQNEKYCRENGHNFSDWEFIEKEHVHYQTGFALLNKDGINENVNCWVRTCNRCGFKQISYINPNKKKILNVLKKK